VVRKRRNVPAVVKKKPNRLATPESTNFNITDTHNSEAVAKCITIRFLGWLVSLE
jgi:hypothetical protein